MNNYIHSLLALVILAMVGFLPSQAGQYDFVFQPPYSAQFQTDFQVDGLYYKIVDGGVELTRAEGPSSTVPHYEEVSLKLPQSVTYNGKTYAVVGIGKDTFMGNRKIKSIKLPEGIEYLDAGAFCYTHIMEFNIPSTLKTIGDEAFAYCNDLKSVEIPDNVETIGTLAFAGCEYLTKITLGTGLKSLGKGCFGHELQFNLNALGGHDWHFFFSKVKDIYCHADVPPTADYLAYSAVPPMYDPFGSENYFLYRDCKLHVPVGSKVAYSEAIGWNAFKFDYGTRSFDNIIDDQQSGLAQTVAKAEGIRLEGGRIVGEGVMDVYDLGGRQVARGTSDQLPELPAGFYIVRNASTTAKILVP